MVRSIDDDITMEPGARPPGRPATLPPGTTLGQYRIVALLGRGGMGEVYVVEHDVLGHRYALKLLPADFASRPDALPRFKREARVMAQLDHPNILKVDEFGEATGRYWLRMELAAGLETGSERARSLRDLVACRGGRLAQEEYLPLLLQILDALDHAHARGVVHRDLKPGNVLLTPAGVKIADFGLVRLVGEDWVRDRAELTVSDAESLGNERTAEAGPAASSARALLGTIEYMSPEQKRGEAADARSDLYAVGLTTFRVLTGRRELAFELPSEIVPDLHPGWDDFVRAALRASPEQRFQTAGDMREAVRRLQRALALPTSSAAADEAPAEPMPSVPTAGADWTVPDVAMEFVWIPAMSCWVGKYPVTNGQFRCFRPEHASSAYEGHDLDGDRQPVTMVSYADAVAFAEWLYRGERDADRLPPHFRYRLPTGTEWTVFARCGDDRIFPWGNDWPPAAGNYAGSALHRALRFSSAIDGYDDVAAVTCAVEESGRNDFGLFGVGGNVWEWTTEAADPGLQVLRGGAWNSAAKATLRCDAREFYHPADRGPAYGFRLVLAP